MRQHFQADRFLQTLRHAWAYQNPIPYMALAITLLAMFITLYISAKDGRGLGIHAEPNALFLIVAFAALCLLYAGLSYSDLSKKSSAQQYLQVPAAVFEKWLSKALLAFVFFPLLTYFALNAVSWIFNQIAPTFFALRYAPLDFGSVEVRTYFILTYMLLPLSFAAGLFWKTKGAIKTFALMLLLGIGLLFLGNSVPVPPQGYSMLEVAPPFLHKHQTSEIQRLSDRFWIFAAYIPSLMLLLSSYFLLKERQL